MAMELVSQLLIGVLVLGGLASHERIPDRLASLDTDSDVSTLDRTD